MFPEINDKYNPQEVEAQAQRHWHANDVYRARESDPRYPRGKFSRLFFVEWSGCVVRYGVWAQAECGQNLNSLIFALGSTGTDVCQVFPALILSTTWMIFAPGSKVTLAVQLVQPSLVVASAQLPSLT